MHFASDTQSIERIVLLRLHESDVARAMAIHSASPSESTLLALGARIVRLEALLKGIEEVAA
jgi:hypothetical protein